MRCLIFTATLNEIDNIDTFVADCLNELPDAHMLVVDDNSPDGTGTRLDQLKEEYQGRLDVIHRPRKLGLGSAHKLAMKYALAQHYDVLVTMDADYSHHPRYLPTLVAALKKSEFVTGSRYVAGGRCDYGVGRQIISRSANVLARTLLGIKLHETTTSYRGFQRSLLEKIPIDQIKAEGYAFFFESIFHASRIAKNTAEFPIHFEDRRAGNSKISKKEILRAMIRLGRLFVRRMLGLFDSYAPRPLPPNAEPCDACGQTLHVEIDPAKSDLSASSRPTTLTGPSHLNGRWVRCLVCGVVATNPKVSIERVTGPSPEMSAPTAPALSLFVSCFLIATLLSPGVWANYMSQPTRKFDADIYLTIARDGYHLPSSPAFYPLWPQILSFFGGYEDAIFIRIANGLSFILFAACLPILWRVIASLATQHVASWMLLLFALNPNSIFHAIGYAESLFSLLSVMFLWSSARYLTSGAAKPLLGVAFFAALLGTSRPIIPQVMAAGFLTLILARWVQAPSPTNSKKQRLWFLTTMSSCFVGYIPFGLFCQERFQNFWQPFTAQSFWDRRLSLNWSLITAPKSVGGSDNILTWDLLAFYAPAALLFLLARRVRSNSSDKEDTPKDLRPCAPFLGVFCLAFAATHSAIAFLTYPMFMSLARHVFATPFVFVGAAIVAMTIKSQAIQKQLTLATITISILYLIYFWTRFGRGAWLG
jgi:dolichol-phosphate mannosyltransferase